MDINQRFKQLRKEFNKTQAEWAKILGLSRSGIGEIEAGRRNVTDKHIKLLIAYDPKINEEWLNTGEGDMFKPVTRSEKIATFAGDLMKNETDSFRRQFVEVLADLDEKEWEVLAGIAEKLTKKGGD